MARNTELIRQWEILQAIDAARMGVTIHRLAQDQDVSTRTIRRDLAALVDAGFPLYDDKVDGTARWKLSAKPFQGLTMTGFSLTELCALYFSRSLLEALSGTQFKKELQRAFSKLEQALPARMKQYLDRLPAIVRAKHEPRKKQDEKRTRELVARLLEASLHQRRVLMRYHSFASRQIKDYRVDPYRLVYAHGGLYLSAFVPEYQQTRTFALERVRNASLLEERFEPRPEAAGEPFPHSLGVHSGEPVRVQIEFDRRITEYIEEREWHASQRLQEQADGSVLMTLDVCTDSALRSWILSFGPLARVVSPASLAEEILEELDEARERYVPRIDFELPSMVFDPAAQRPLPFPQPADRVRPS